MVSPTKEESRYQVGSVEAWKCTKCGRDERFPRYNNPVKLLATRRGRCGEFANVSLQAEYYVDMLVFRFLGSCYGG